jgi:acyl carrier protein
MAASGETSMTSEQIEARVRETLAKKFGVPVEKINSESPLVDLGVDSFGAIELMFELEEAFGLQIADSEIEHISKVGDIVAYLDAWQKKKEAG